MRLDVATVLRGTHARVVRLTGGRLTDNGLSPADLVRTFGAVTIDSRSVVPDALFTALRGERADGHDYVRPALERGALGCIVRHVPDERALADVSLDISDARYFFVVPDPLSGLQRLAAHWRTLHPVEVIGITGSIGKTTTKEIVASVLESRYKVLKSEANFNTEIGLPLTLLNLRGEHRVAVLEMGMYAPGDIALLARIARPRIGIVTNVAPIHLERVGSIAGIARAKSELIAELPGDGLAILNGDDPWTRAMAKTSGVARSLLVGLTPQCDYRASNVQVRGLEGVSFTLEAEGEQHPVTTQVPGRHTVHAFLAAAAAARAVAMPWPDVQAAMARTRLDERQRLIRGDGVLIIDDSYNAAPMSVSAALELLRESPGIKIAVLGDMLELGPEEEKAHREVGERAASVADWLVARGSRSAWIAEAAEAHGLPSGRVRRAADNLEAVAAVRKIMTGEERDPTSENRWSVLVKGSRGMRMEEVVDGLRGSGWR